MSGLASLLWTGLRTGWATVLALPAALGAGLVTIALAIKDLYPDAQDRIAYARSLGEFTPSIALNGRGYDLTTAGGIVAEELGIVTLLALPVLGIHLAVRLTRAEEDSGRLELLTAGRVSRSAPMLSGMTLGLMSVAVLYAALAAGLILIDLPTAGSLRYAAALSGLLAAHLGIGWVIAQVSRDARTAYGAGLVVTLAAYLGRLVSDVRGWDATWLSPSGWAAEVRPWAEDPPAWPLVAFLATTLLGLGVSWFIAARRDLGDGLLSPRPGPAEGGALLRGPRQLAWRLVRWSAVGWLLGLTVFAFGIGLIAEEMQRLTEQNPQLVDVMGSGLDSLAALILILLSLGAAAAGVQSVGVLLGEEEHGRTGLVLAAPVSRLRWWGGVAVLGTLQIVATMLAGTTALAAAMALALEDASWWGTCFEAAISVTPAAVAVMGATLLAGAIVPAARHVGWMLVAWSLVATVFDELLDLPAWATGIAPWDWVGRAPAEATSWWGVAALLGVSVVAIAVSATVFSRRDLVAG